MNEGVFKSVKIRNGSPSDHGKILAVMPEWWHGRDLTRHLLKIFFIHFKETIFIAEKDSDLIGFVIGFLSQSEPDEAYIHLLGVHPGMRRLGLGRLLYKEFFEVCQKKGRSIFRACTSPLNKLSVEFHRHMGFQIEPGDDLIDGLPVTKNYLRENEPKVLFKKVVG